MSEGGTFRYTPGNDSFGPYRIETQVRRNDLYEQYVVALESGVRLSLKTIYPQLAPQVTALDALREPFSVGLLSVIDFGPTPTTGEVFVVTELAGTTLRERLEASGPFAPAQAISHLGDMARALATVEARALPMPTVTPDAVCLRQDGVRMDDYFLPMLFEGQSVRPSLHLAAYSAPEIDLSGASSKSTLFSLGLVLHEILTGKPPFSGSVFQVIAAIRTVDADLTRAPEPLRPLLSRLLARDPAQRFGSLAELAAALSSGAHVSDSTQLASTAESGAAAPATGPAHTGPELESVGVGEGGRPEFCRSLDGATMVLVPGGTFTMGSLQGTDGEKPPVTVTVEPFLIDKHTVTWEMFVTAHTGHDKSCEFCAVRQLVLPSRFMPTPIKSRDEGERSDLEKRFAALNDAISAPGGENIPVSYLTWREMQRYAEFVGAELPSEAEWEFANRAGSDTRYPWGNDMDGARAWYPENSGGVPHPVAQKQPNSWGLHDMNGNLLEMCRDRFVKEIYEMIAAGAASVEELVEGVERPGGRYSARGGAFTSAESGITASFRIGAAPDLRSEVRGFRCVIRRKNAPHWARQAFEEL